MMTRIASGILRLSLRSKWRWSLRFARVNRTYPPVDPKEWPPFPKLGDIDRTLKDKGYDEMDLSRPIPDYACSDELKTADPLTKRIYSLEFAPHSIQMEALISNVRSLLQLYPGDRTSNEALIAELTVRLRFMLSQYIDYRANKRSLMILRRMVAKRNELIWELRETNFRSFLHMMKTLRIRYVSRDEWFAEKLTDRQKQRIPVEAAAQKMVREKLQKLEENFEANLDVLEKTTAALEQRIAKQKCLISEEELIINNSTSQSEQLNRQLVNEHLESLCKGSPELMAVFCQPSSSQRYSVE